MSAVLVKQLRDMTGAGFLDCQTAIRETNGNIDAAVEWLKEKGIAKAAKKASNVAAEGLGIVLAEGNHAIIAEVNAQTDFVAKNEDFLNYLNRTGKALLAAKPATLEQGENAIVEGTTTVKDLLIEATAKIGENIKLRRCETLTKTDADAFGAYAHNAGKIVVLVQLDGTTNEAAAKDVAMHVAAMNPKFYNRDEMNQDDLAKIEAEIIDEIKQDPKMANKPDNILAGIAKGRLEKKLSDVVLVDQPFVKDDSQTVGKFIASKGGRLAKVVRYAVGEGIVVEQTDFAAEVAAQMAAATK